MEKQTMTPEQMQQAGLRIEKDIMTGKLLVKKVSAGHDGIGASLGEVSRYY